MYPSTLRSAISPPSCPCCSTCTAIPVPLPQHYQQDTAL
jgi:hypothetical protein